MAVPVSNFHWILRSHIIQFLLLIEPLSIFSTWNRFQLKKIFTGSRSSPVSPIQFSTYVEPKINANSLRKKLYSKQPVFDNAVKNKRELDELGSSWNGSKIWCVLGSCFLRRVSYYSLWNSLAWLRSPESCLNFQMSQRNKNFLTLQRTEHRVPVQRSCAGKKLDNQMDFLVLPTSPSVGGWVVNFQW